MLAYGLRKLLMEGDGSIFGNEELDNVVEGMSELERGGGEEGELGLGVEEGEFSEEGTEMEGELEGEGEVGEIECEEEDISTDVLLFTFFMLFIGLVTRNILGKIPIPYTGMLLVRGACFDVWFNFAPVSRSCAQT